MRCKWLICLEFSPPKSPALETANKQPRWKVDAKPVIARKRRVPGTSRQADCTADESTFCEYDHGIPCCSLQSCTTGCMRIQVRTSPLTVSPLITTTVSLIFICLQRLWVLLFGMNQREALVNWAQAAAIPAAHIRLTPAPSIHAPTPRHDFAG